MKLKTGTKISLIFTLFVFLILFLLLLVINTYTFFTWYNDESKEVRVELEKELEETIEKNNGFDLQKAELISELEEDGGFIGNGNLNYKNIFLDLYFLDEEFFIISIKNTQFGTIYLPYDITIYFKNQLILFYISIFSLLIFSIISFFISKFLFIRLALKDIFRITNKLKNINLENIKKINLDLDSKDEIYEIINSINKFLSIIESDINNLKEFNTNVSHEFKTPLMIISSQIEYAIKTNKCEESLVKIEKQVDLLNQLLETFLFVSKVQNSKISVKLKYVNISKIIINIVSELENLYLFKNIKISKNIKDDIFIQTDEKLFFLIIKNLIDNSFKYTKEFGKIEIYLDEESFKIKDNGIGISEDKLENIFDNFYRESSDEKGYGIGLNIVNKIIKILDYKISIKSEKGVGSEFLIKFN